MFQGTVPVDIDDDAPAPKSRSTSVPKKASNGPSADVIAEARALRDRMGAKNKPAVD